jgi:hypothetical protein
MTTTVPVRAGITAASQFDDLPHDTADTAAIPLSRVLIERFSGEQLAIPDVRSRLDAVIAARAAFNHPGTSDPSGWHLHFGRELNATDDRRHFGDRGEMPIVEGKQIRPFSVTLAESRLFIDRVTALKLLRHAPFDRPRLAYRDVASATNRVTLIAGILPAGALSTHTVFCLRTPLEEDEQLFVMGMFNSFVANFLVRLRVTTHVTVAIVAHLPLPKPAQGSREFQDMVGAVRRLLDDPEEVDAMARVQALAARLYGIDASEFSHVLSTFPLVEARVRQAALEAFVRTI